MENHSKIFSGNEVEVLAIKDLLELHEIEYIVKNDIQSANMVGLPSIGASVHIFVKDSDFNRALKLIDNIRYDEMAD